VAIEALFMKNWEEDDRGDYCAAAVDLADAQGVADTLGIPLHAVNFAHDYWERVFEHFLAEYRAGRTPNPDVLCNREIKFRAFLDHALDRGAAAIATGHYARVAHAGGRWRLLRGRDADKDQSYFLHALDQEQLAHARFPLGDLEKPAVRRLARDAGLATHDRRDSTGICFIGERRFKAFLQRYLPAQPGAIRTPDGVEIGRHDGLMYYTLGQRHGLGIGGRRDAGGAPWYVVGKRLAENVLLVAQGHDHPLLLSRGLAASQAHWIGGEPRLPLDCTAKVRYRMGDLPCRVDAAGDGRLTVRFTSPQRAVTPGQSVVFYAGEECLGGAVIESPHDL
jgi:tRNA-specific 2-thiouridylase